MKYIDIHCHLNLSDFNSDLDLVISRMREKDVGGIIVGTDLESSLKAVEIAEKYDNLYAIIGIHPTEASNEKNNISFLEKLVVNPKVVGIGECGLDYFRIEKTQENLKLQEKLFRFQIELALKYNKPLMLHIRSSNGTQDAYEDVLQILSEYKKEYTDPTTGGPRGNVHFFAGSQDIMQRFFDINFTVSFTGVITFTHDYDELIREAPLDKIMAETDAPYVAPVPYRGTRCESVHVIEVYKKIAETKKSDEEVVRKQIVENARELFHL